MKTNTCKRCQKEFTSVRKATACSSACRNWLYVQTRKEVTKSLMNASYHRRKIVPKNIIKNLFKYAKSRAQKKNIPFLIQEEDIKLPEKCPIFRTPFIKGDIKYTYSIDRINSTLGYTKENIQVISKLANAMKWDSTREERLAFAKWILSSEGG